MSPGSRMIMSAIGLRGWAREGEAASGNNALPAATALVFRNCRRVVGIAATPPYCISLSSGYLLDH